MQEFTYKDFPIKVFGIPHFEKHKTLERLPGEVIEKIPSLSFLGRRPMGARLGFRTNSPKFTLKIEFETLGVDIGMATYAITKPRFLKTAFIRARKWRKLQFSCHATRL